MKLSIVTVVRNALPQLKESLEPLIGASDLNLEFVVVDGNSTDGTKEYLQNKTLPNFKYLSEPDTGIYNAMNKGIKLATGEYVYFLNAGDQIHDLGIFRKIFQNLQGDDIYYCNILFQTASGLILRRYPEKIDLDFWFDGFMCHQAVIFRRDLFDKMGLYNEKYRFAADFDFLFRSWYDKSVSLKHIDEVIAVYDMNGVSSNPANGPKVMKEYAVIQRKTLPLSIYLKKNGLIPIIKFFNRNFLLKKIKAIGKRVIYSFIDRPIQTFNFYFNESIVEKKPMRVLHLSTYAGIGGAAIAAFRINKALNEIGVQSQFACMFSDFSNPMVTSLRQNNGIRRLKSRFNRYLESFLTSFQRGSRRGLMTMGMDSVVDFKYLEALIHQFDPHVIHLHWINHGFLNIEDVARLGRPIVWTFHDMWPFLGVKHYTSNPSYKNGFGESKGIENLVDIDRHTWLRKKESWAHFIPDAHAICPSQWMKDAASESSLWKPAEISVVANVIDCKEFTPVDRKLAREILKIPNHFKRVVLFGAASPFAEPYKGFDSFLSVLKILTADENPGETFVITFGASHGIRMLNGIGHKHFESVKSSDFLNVIYSAADVMAVASEMEAFCLVAAEAQACGIPVVCFDTSGLRDVVDHLKTGYRAKLQDFADFANGIRWVLEDSTRYRTLSEQARIRCLEKFDAPKVANQHYEIYHAACQMNRVEKLNPVNQKFVIGKN